MKHRCMCLLVMCLILFPCCRKKAETVSGGVQLPRLGITFKIPPNFMPLPADQLGEIGAMSADVDPFAATPRYAYADSSGKGILVISELEINEGIESEKYPLDTIYMYKKNLESYYDVPEIASEEINSNDITTVILAMMFDEELSLFKGLCYKYPDRFFMLDLYVVNSQVTKDDAFGFQNIFNSLGIY